MRTGISCGLSLVLLAYVPSTLSAQCVIFDKPEELYARSDVVFRGTAVAQKPTGIGGSHVIVQIATFQVDQTWKGQPGRQVAVGADEPFEIGKEYLVFAGGKPMSTSIECRAAELVDHAKGKLEWLSTNVRLPISPPVAPSRMEPIKAVARAMNWPELQEPAGVDAVSEVRITDWYPNWAGAQVPLLRLLHNGTHFEAQLFAWWPKRDSPPMPRAGTGIVCGDQVDWSEVCVKAVPVPVGHDWDEVATQALKLKEPCRPPKIPVPTSPGSLTGAVSTNVDSGDLLIEALEGRAYHTYWCNAPTSGSVDRAALDVYNMLVALGRSSPRIR